MTEQSPEIKIDPLNESHGLCETAETHWLLYVATCGGDELAKTTQNIELRGGKSLTVLQKGSVTSDGFNFGENSYFVVESDDKDLVGLILRREKDGNFTARFAIDLGQALRINEYEDLSISPRWKLQVKKFLEKYQIDPDRMSLLEICKMVIGGHNEDINH